MRSMIRWSPLDEALPLRQAMDRMFEERFIRPSLRNRGAEGTRAAGLPIDLYETDDALILKARPPGMNPEDVEISVNGGNLGIKAEVGSDATPDDAAGRTWHRPGPVHGAGTR
ncbi:MAG: Hsp20/alpha crystallin family protein, partial [Ardenticatenia bacterium]|nr:Hsp20/alpha crystallin family protein [Ardenticatenia bacterium]